MINRRSIGNLGWLLTVAVLLTGCSRNDADRLGKIGKIVSLRIEAVVGDMTDDFSQRLHQSRENRQQHQLSWQITKRLESDKGLADCKIEVFVQDNQVELKGRVKDTQQRRHAVEIVESTTGVTRVKDSLKTADEEP